MSKAEKIIEELSYEGFTYEQIEDAMCDGEYLGKEGIDQETAEEARSMCRELAQEQRKKSLLEA